MRYPLWAFFFVLVMPVFTAHALLAGKAHIAPGRDVALAQPDAGASAYWTHRVASR